MGTKDVLEALQNRDKSPIEILNMTLEDGRTVRQVLAEEAPDLLKRVPEGTGVSDLLKNMQPWNRTAANEARDQLLHTACSEGKTPESALLVMAAWTIAAATAVTAGERSEALHILRQIGHSLFRDPDVDRDA